MKSYWIWIVLLFLLCFSSLSWAKTDSPASFSLKIKEGIRSFHQLEYEKAKISFQEGLNRLNFLLKTSSPATKRREWKKLKLRALRYLSVCYYNLEQQKNATTTWQEALEIQESIELPKGQAPHVIVFFAKISKAPKPRKKTIAKQSLALKVLPLSPKKRSGALPTKKKKEKIVLVGEPMPIHPSRFPVGGTLLLSLGVISSVSAGILILVLKKELQEVRETPPELIQAALYKQKQAELKSQIVTGLWIATSVFIGSSVLSFVLELRKPKRLNSLPTRQGQILGKKLICVDLY